MGKRKYLVCSCQEPPSYPSTLHTCLLPHAPRCAWCRVLEVGCGCTCSKLALRTLLTSASLSPLHSPSVSPSPPLTPVSVAAAHTPHAVDQRFPSPSKPPYTPASPTLTQALGVEHSWGAAGKSYHQRFSALLHPSSLSAVQDAGGGVRQHMLAAAAAADKCFPLTPPLTFRTSFLTTHPCAW